MPNPIELHTDRLILKGITPAIIHEMFKTKTKSEIIEFFGFDEVGYETYKEMHEKGMETHRITVFFFLLIDKQNNAPIGECGFHTLNQTHKRADLFYSLRSDEYKQKGLMTEALQVVLEYGFKNLNLHRIAAFIADTNLPSKKLLLRYGFTKEGTMREDYVVDDNSEDSDCYSLLSWEWDKSK